MRWQLCAAVLVAVSLPAHGQTPEIEKAVNEKLATIRYLRSLQQPDGSFLASAQDPKLDPAPRGGLRATSAAVRALKYFGGEVPDAKAATKFVHRCFDGSNGGFSDQPDGKPELFLTAVGLMAVAELKMPVEQYAPKAVKYLSNNAKSYEDIRISVAGMEAVQSFPDIVHNWHKEVLKMSNGDGTWGKDDAARATGGSVALLLRSGGKLDAAHQAKALEVLRAGQRDDGGFAKDSKAASDLETTYRILRAFHLMKEKPKDTARLREFVAKCRNKDGGYGAAPGQPSNVGGTYYAAVILHWLEVK